MGRRVDGRSPSAEAIGFTTEPPKATEPTLVPLCAFAALRENFVGLASRKVSRKAAKAQRGSSVKIGVTRG